MFVDSSVIIAILSKEADAAALADWIDVGGCMTLALVILESTMRLVSKLNLDPVLAERRVQAFLEAAQIRLAPMDGMTAAWRSRLLLIAGRAGGAKLNSIWPIACLMPAQRRRAFRFFTKGKIFSIRIWHLQKHTPRQSMYKEYYDHRLSCQSCDTSQHPESLLRH